MAVKRKYPVGIQSFEKLRTDGYIYVDKTKLIYKMITEGCPYFLSRPRRFGKSLLVSTLQAIFEGRRDLFDAFTTEGGIEQPQLFIAQSDWKWEKYPVIRFDFGQDLMDIGQLDRLIDAALAGYERLYGITPNEKDPFMRMGILVQEAHRQTGKRVVILVDEYDKQMLHAIGDDELAEGVRARFKNLFSPLKELDEHLQFVFITGISKFSQMGVFSTINHLNNISMQPAYEAICGITEEELTTTMREDIQMLAEKMGKSYDDTFAELKKTYDGYHFSEGMTDVYNPFSLVKALSSEQIKKYWFDSATPSALIDMLRQMPPLDLKDLDGVSCEQEAFDAPFDSFSAPLPALYQSGYLTIKDFNRSRQMYTLGFPNYEVRTGFADCLYQIVSDTTPGDDNRNVFLEAYYDFRDFDDLPTFIEAIKTFFAGVPYQWERDNKNEHYYHALLYTLLTAFGAEIRAEEPTAKGSTDMTLFMPKGIYVMEIKYGKQEENTDVSMARLAQAAIDQINTKGYAEKYRLDGLPVTKVGIAFSSSDRNIADWKAELLV